MKVCVMHIGKTLKYRQIRAIMIVTGEELNKRNLYSLTRFSSPVFNVRSPFFCSTQKHHFIFLILFVMPADDPGRRPPLFNMRDTGAVIGIPVLGSEVTPPVTLQDSRAAIDMVRFLSDKGRLN